jgi:UDP-N-acetylglucosamine acyltransferase
MDAVVHQRRVVGPGAMVGMGAVVTRDVPPFAKSYGNPARTVGANVVGLERMGVSDEVAHELDSTYRAGGRGADPPVGLLGHPALRGAAEWWAGRHA